MMSSCDARSNYDFVSKLRAYSNDGNEEFEDRCWRDPMQYVEPDYVHPMWNYQEHLLELLDQIRQDGYGDQLILMVVDPRNPIFYGDPMIDWYHDTERANGCFTLYDKVPAIPGVRPQAISRPANTTGCPR